MNWSPSAALVSVENRLQRPGDRHQIAVVDGAGVELPSELVECVDPFSVFAISQRCAYIDRPLHHVNSSQTGGRCARLLPGALAAPPSTTSVSVRVP